MGAQTAAGSKIFIGPANAVASDAAAFEALTYTKIGRTEEIGAFGGEFGEQTFIELENRLVQKFKTSEDPGTIEVPMAFDSADAGQTALVAAYGSDNEYAFKVELNDEDEESPTTFYFRGRVMSNIRNIGAVDNVIRRNVRISINTRPIEVAAA